MEVRPLSFKRKTAQPLWVMPPLSIPMKSNEFSYRELFMGLSVWSNRQKKRIRRNFRYCLKYFPTFPARMQGLRMKPAFRILLGFPHNDHGDNPIIAFRFCRTERKLLGADRTSAVCNLNVTARKNMPTLSRLKCVRLERPNRTSYTKVTIRISVSLGFFRPFRGGE